MQPSGNISDLSLPSLFHKIFKSQTTGILRLTQGKLIKEIYFRSGSPVYVKSNILSETLGRVLLEKGLLSQEDYERSLQVMQATKKPHGTILRELGVLKIGLEDALHLQTVHKLITCFRWKEGTYAFRSMKDLPAGIEQFPINPSAVVLQGIRFSTTLEELTEKFSGYMDDVLADGSGPYTPADMGLPAREEEVFRLIDGKKTFKDVLEMSALGLQDTLALLYALIVLEVVRPASLAAREARPAEPPPAPTPADAAPAADVSPEDLALRDRLDDRLARIKEQNHYQILGLVPGSPKDQVKKAYYQLAKEFHPDKYYDRTQEIRGLTDEIFSLITQAQAILTNDEERKKYDEFLRTGKTEDDMAREATNIFNGEIAHQKGLTLLKKGDVKGAADQFRRALELNPAEAEYHIYVGWTQFRLATPESQDLQKAKEEIRKGLAANQRIAQGHYFLGMINKKEGREGEAREAFQKAIQCNPNHVDALREIRLMAMRDKKEEKGLFGKIFKT